jgi:hypothetical protein
MAVKAFPTVTALFLQPGSTLPLTLKVTFPATDAVAVTFFAWRKIRLPPASEIVAPTVALLKVKVKFELVALV